MSFEITMSVENSKEEAYRQLLPQIYSLIEEEKNFIANLANITSALKYSFENFLWVGFYLNNGNDELVLGPFQGRVACTRIPFGKGVCGAAAARKETIIVDDVDKFPGHIVCDSLSKSEIVIPVIKKNKTVSVLDIDSSSLGGFDEIDRKYLENLIEGISHLFNNEI